MDEPDLTGGMRGYSSQPPLVGGKMEIPGLSDTASQLRAVNEQLSSLKDTLKDITSNSQTYTQGVNSVLGGISQSAASAAQNLSAPVGGSLGGGGGAYSSATGVSYASSNTPSSNILGSITSALGSGGKLSGPSGLATTLGNLLMTPIQYAFDRTEENRANAMGMAQSLGRTATMSGTTIEKLIQTLSESLPVQGGINQMLGAIDIASQTGYGNFESNRSGAYFTALRQMQTLTPGVGADQLASQFSGYLGNTGAQQRSMMLTGGAMSGFGPGGAPKTLQEWAEGLIKFFQNQRPGQARGKAFTKEELEVQMFPGSNMDAWMNVNGVPDYMRDYFWQYALAKTTITGSTSGDVTFAQIQEARGTDLAADRLRTNSATARREFTFAGASGLLGTGSMYEMFSEREGADRWFSSALNQMDKVIGTLAAGVGPIIGRIPTPIASTMMGALKTIPTLLGQGVGTIPTIGDPEWGEYGGTGLGHMDPSFARKVQAMMEANPNITVTSGFRDGALQGRLHAAGVGMTAPAGQSMHGRGLAADLGPESEFGWIQANAHLFGLENAAHLGEPWHVGAPGTVPMGDPHVPGKRNPQPEPAGPSSTNPSRSNDKGFTPSEGKPKSATPSPSRTNAGGINIPGKTESDNQGGDGIIDQILGKLNPLNALTSIFSPITSVLGFAGDLFGGVQSLLSGDFSGLFGQGGLFDIGSLIGKIGGGLFDLFGLPDAFNPSKIMAGEVDFSDPNTIGSIGSIGRGAHGGGGSLGTRLTSSTDWSSRSDMTPLDSMTSGQRPATGGPTGVVKPADVAAILKTYGGGWSGPAAPVGPHEQAIVNALAAANKAGFSGNELVTIGAIAGRESTWNPKAHFKGPRDDSYGLWQINMLGDMGPARKKQFGLSSYSDLFDPNVNAKAAYGLYTGRGGTFRDWGFTPLTKAQTYVQPVYDIAKKHGFIGDPRRNGMLTAPVSATFSPSSTSIMSSQPIHIENVFHIQSTGGEVDSHRLAAVATDKMMEQMLAMQGRMR